MSATDPASLPYRPCVGVMLANAEGRVFTGERLDMPGAWQMPQGGIDPGEAPRQAALRELTEETGIPPAKVAIEAEHPDWIRYDLPPDLLGKVWKGKFRGQEQRWFLMRFSGTETDIDIATAHPEFSRWCWLPPGELVEKIVPFKRAVYAQVLRAFQARL